ncbi:hypothetical protein DESPIGER_1619 [Desulfovibrio piger]|uniref:Uncharacterized protein n=1 Tax=Desulfovibrio piger TaxID=901 RepID=A0A1K1LFI4_9BACT|nr:hypothetical protein DESPIGER_1619 [Desulfovibrio piger]
MPPSSRRGVLPMPGATGCPRPSRSLQPFRAPAPCRAAQDTSPAGRPLCGRARNLRYSGININNCQGQKGRLTVGPGRPVSLHPVSRSGCPVPCRRGRHSAVGPRRQTVRPFEGKGAPWCVMRHARGASRASPALHGARSGATGRKILSPGCENPGRALASCPRFRVEGGP